MVKSGDSLYVGASTNGTDTCGGSSHDYAFKISTTSGQADAAFDPGANAMVRAVAINGGALYLGGSFTTPRPKLARVDLADGHLDSSYHPSLLNSNAVFALAPEGPAMFVGGDFTSIDSVAGTANMARVQANGTVDPAFRPAVRGGDVHTITPDGQGHVYIGGVFSPGNVSGTDPIVGGAMREHVARLDAATGAADAWHADANGEIEAIALAGDRVLLGGFQDITGGAVRHGLAAFDRVTGKLLPADARLDNSVWQLAQAGAALYALGDFEHSGNLTRHGLVKLDPATGAADPVWDPGDGNGGVDAIAITDGALYAGGYFAGADTVGGASPDYLAKLSLDGSGAADPAFDAHLDGGVDLLAADGSALYVSGPFTHASGASRGGLAKLAAADGAVATALATGSSTDYNALVAGDGKLYVGGSFSSFAGAPRANLARIDGTTGALDDWQPSTNGGVASISLEGNTVYVGTNPDDWPAPGIAALSATTGAAVAGFPGDVVDYAQSVDAAGGSLYVGGSLSGSNRSFWVLRTRAPQATAAPELTGDARLGATLGCSDGRWSADPERLDRRWLRDGAPIEGASGSTYRVAGADAGHSVSCQVTATNERGSAAATSAPLRIADVPVSTPPGEGPGATPPPPAKGKVKAVRCKVKGRVARCAVTFAGAPRKVGAKLLRGKQVVAKASGRATLVFTARRRLKPGRYTLIVDGTRLRLTVKR
jgi:hypothetical protein